MDKSKSKHRVPAKTRRLTKAENARLGYSQGAKRRVNANVKHVTRKTVVYTDRQVAEAKLGTRKETYTKSRTRTVTRKNKTTAKVYENISKAELMKRLRHLGDGRVTIAMLAETKRTGGRYNDVSEVWVQTGQWNANQVVENFPGFLKFEHVIGTPKMYGLYVL